MEVQIEECFAFAVDLTKKAGELIREKVTQNKSIESKSSDIDLVTETDQQVEKLLIESLTEKFPGHKFIGEESAAESGCNKLTSDPTWIIDPIDGTMNFIHAFPHSCISIGLFVNKEPAIGIIYNPMLEQLYTAKKGQGAYLNGKKLHVSKETDISKALLMMENGTSRDPVRLEALFNNQRNLIPLVHGTRSLGSAALDIGAVATGGADAYFEFGIHIWDTAAGELLITEAGGVVIDPAGGKFDRFARRVLCANSMELAQALAKNIVQYYPMPRDD